MFLKAKVITNAILLLLLLVAAATTAETTAETSAETSEAVVKETFCRKLFEEEVKKIEHLGEKNQKVLDDIAMHIDAFFTYYDERNITSGLVRLQAMEHTDHHKVDKQKGGIKWDGGHVWFHIFESTMKAIWTAAHKKDLGGMHSELDRAIQMAKSHSNSSQQVIAFLKEMEMKLRSKYKDRSEL